VNAPDTERGRAHEPQRKQNHGGDKDNQADLILSSVDTTMGGYRRT